MKKIQTNFEFNYDKYHPLEKDTNYEQEYQEEPILEQKSSNFKKIFKKGIYLVIIIGLIIMAIIAVKDRGYSFTGNKDIQISSDQSLTFTDNYRFQTKIVLTSNNNQLEYNYNGVRRGEYYKFEKEVDNHIDNYYQEGDNYYQILDNEKINTTQEVIFNILDPKYFKSDIIKKYLIPDNLDYKTTYYNYTKEIYSYKINDNFNINLLNEEDISVITVTYHNLLEYNDIVIITIYSDINEIYFS